MSTLITVIHVTTCAFLILVVLLQSGKGAEISASLSGSSQTVFGSAGGSNFFTKLTTVLAIIFMLTSVTLTIMSSQNQKSVFENAPASAPVAPVTTPANTVPAPAASH
mgnify:CR=1 FL=1